MSASPMIVAARKVRRRLCAARRDRETRIGSPLFRLFSESYPMLTKANTDHLIGWGSMRPAPTLLQPLGSASTPRPLLVGARTVAPRRHLVVELVLRPPALALALAVLGQAHLVEDEADDPDHPDAHQHRGRRSANRARDERPAGDPDQRDGDARAVAASP